MKEITVKISNKIALCQKRYLISSNSNYSVKFEFDDEWSSEPLKTARILFADKVYEIPFAGNTVELPKIPFCSEISVGVYSANLASTFASLGCIVSCADCDAENIYEFTTDQYNAIVELINVEKRKVVLNSASFTDGVLTVGCSDGSEHTFKLFGDGLSCEDYCTKTELEAQVEQLEQKIKSIETAFGVTQDESLLNIRAYPYTATRSGSTLILGE